MAAFASSVGSPPYDVSFGPFLGSKPATAALALSVAGVPEINVLSPGHPIRATGVQVLSGDPAILDGVEFGVKPDGQLWVALVLKGNWLDHPLKNADSTQSLSWRIRDKMGHEQPVAFSEHFYTKDDAGRISPAATKIAIIYDPQMDLSNLSVELGTEGVILDWPWKVRLD